MAGQVRAVDASGRMSRPRSPQAELRQRRGRVGGQLSGAGANSHTRPRAVHQQNGPTDGSRKGLCNTCLDEARACDHLRARAGVTQALTIADRPLLCPAIIPRCHPTDCSISSSRHRRHGRSELRHLVASSAHSIENALAMATRLAPVLRLSWPGSASGDDASGAGVRGRRRLRHRPQLGGTPDVADSRFCRPGAAWRRSVRDAVEAAVRPRGARGRLTGRATAVVSAAMACVRTPRRRSAHRRRGPHPPARAGRRRDPRRSDAASARQRRASCESARHQPDQGISQGPSLVSAPLAAPLRE